MERLDYLIENFKQEAWDTFYQNTGYGGYGYQKQDAQKIDTSDPMEAIERAAGSWQSKMTDQQVDAIIAAMKRNAIAAPSIEVTEDNWTDNVDTPIGNVKMGEHQKEKLFKNARQGQYGMVLETLSHPDIILEEMDKDEDPSHERPSSYLFVKTFTKPDGNKYVHFESVTVSKDGMEVSISSHIIRENQLRNKLKSDRLLYNATALDKSANSSAEQPINDGGSHSSDGKDSKNKNTKQEKQSKHSF
jgi:Spy/CpxP family protein refolding chaperone